MNNKTIGMLCCIFGVSLIAVALFYILKIVYVIHSFEGKVSLDQTTISSLTVTFPAMIIGGIMFLIFGVRKLREQ